MSTLDPIEATMKHVLVGIVAVAIIGLVGGFILQVLIALLRLPSLVFTEVPRLKKRIENLEKRLQLWERP